jgi:hypothetical protein
MSAHPYRSLPESSFWRKAVARPQASDVDPVTSFTLKIDRETKVATAGSCFAQHIARHLAACGFNYFVPEPGHGILPEAVRKSHGYGLFSCRYGNIYTARQLWQLFERAFERFEPREDSWSKGPDVWLDPFRPTAQPGGFISNEEMRADRRQHLAAVRRMFEEVDVFVFTLGLTECWRSRADGAVFPVCPGVEGGTFDPEQHEFYNQPLEDIIDDLVRLREALAEINPSAAILLTVSPVPLVATADPLQHVLTATTYSKSVLRVAADIMRRRFDNVHYFPSFEIVTGAHARGRYFADDLRNVLEPGVEHVMRLFMKHASGSAVGHEARPKPDLKEDDYLKEAEQLVQVECDEIALERE